MNKILVILSMLLASKSSAQFRDTTNGLELDHIFILTDKKDTSINKLVNAGLTGAVKWKTPHKGQGTTGDFIFFLNFYLEILQITDTIEAAKNKVNFGTDINLRLADGTSRIGFGLRQIPMQKEKIPFATKSYNQRWMGKDSLYMSVTNSNVNEPLIFAEPPSFANMVVDKIEDLDKYAANNPEMKTYRQHALKLEKLTAVTIFVTGKKKTWSPALKTLSKLNNVTVKQGKTHLLILYFDGEQQQQQLDFTKELGLLIHY